MATTFQFIPETHEYIEDGVRRDSVTQILQETGIVNYGGIDEDVLRHAAERGTAAHAACHYYDENDLDISTVDPEVIPYLCGYQKFLSETRFIVEGSERRGIAEIDGMRYGYTYDRKGILFKRRVIAELKCTAAIEIGVGPQTAAYELAERQESGEAARNRVVIHLKPNGTYSLIELNDIKDYQVWKWALGITHWKRMKGRN